MDRLIGWVGGWKRHVRTGVKSLSAGEGFNPAVDVAGARGQNGLGLGAHEEAGHVCMGEVGGWVGGKKRELREDGFFLLSTTASFFHLLHSGALFG